MKLQIILAILLYILIYLVRYQQGGWEIETELLKDWRSNLDKQIQIYLPSPQAELFSGILLGQNKDLPGHFRLALRDTSTLHIVVASGQNLSMVAGFFLLLSGVIKRKVAIFLSFFSILFYVLLTGAQVPILRAAIMVTLTFLANIIGREKDGAWVLGVTAGLMLFVNPKWLFDLSFQLSVLATAGVVVVAPIILEKIKFLPNFIGQDLAVSFGAQMMVLGVVASNFHQLSLVSLPTNMLILWTVPIIMILGSIFLFLSLVVPTFAYILSFFINALLTYFIYIVQFFASLPFAWEYVGEFHWIVWVGYYLIISGVLKVIYDLKEK